MPPSEPTPSDISAVANSLGIPETVPQQQPQAPTPQPAPSQQPQQPQAPVQQPVAQPAPSADPFEGLFQTPTPQPTEPAVPQPTQPTEVAQPAPQAPTATPVAEPAQPAVPEVPAPQTSQEYLDSLTAGLPEVPKMPDVSQVNPDDEASIGKFFEDLMTTAKEQFRAEYTRDEAIKNAERNAWNDAFDAYPSLEKNKNLRDTVHAIRRAQFDKGIAITPKQAAESLLASIDQSYRRGITDNQVQTTYEQVQPTGGNTQPVDTSLTQTNVLEAVQTGGEAAVEQWLNQEIAAGRM